MQEHGPVETAWGLGETEAGVAAHLVGHIMEVGWELGYLVEAVGTPWMTHLDHPLSA